MPSGEVLDLGGRHEGAASIERAGNDHGLQASARRVNGGGVARRARTDDHNVAHGGVRSVSRRSSFGRLGLRSRKADAEATAEGVEDRGLRLRGGHDVLSQRKLATVKQNKGRWEG